MRRSLQILLFYWAAAIETQQRIQPFENDETNDLMVLNCVNAVGRKVFPQTQNVEIISPSIVLHSFEDFGLVIRSTPSEFKYPDFRRSLTKYAVIFLEGIDGHEKDLQTLSILSRSDPQGRFIVPIKSEFDPSDSRGSEYLNKIITFLASIERWKVYILLKDSENRSIRLFTYTLFSTGNCSRKPQLVDLGNCDDAKTLNNLSPAYINFHKCLIKMSVINSPPYIVVVQLNQTMLSVHGVESKILELIMDKLNATSKMFSASNGTSLRQSVQTREVDLCWSNILQYEVAGTIWTQSYIFVQSVLVIPRNRLMPLWMNLILPFQAEVWATLGMVLALHLVIQLLIPSIRRQFHIKWMLSSFFGSGISRLPTRIPQRLYVAYWLIVGYIVTQCYLASLTGFFASPGQYRPMQTLNEVDESGIVVGGISHMRNPFQEFNPGIYRNFKALSDMEYFENIENLKKGTGGVATYAPLRVVTNITSGRAADFNIINEYVGYFPIATMLPNSSYILEGCNRVINYIFASGLIRFWEQYEDWELHHAVSQHQDYNYQTSIEHLQAVFIILGIGNCLSCIVFAVELVLPRFSKSN